MSDSVEILRLGHVGDGVTADGRYVPYAAPGDIVRLDGDAEHPRIAEIVTSGPSRVAPLCRHFLRCGGCVLQHIAREPYLEWKRECVVVALEQRGFVTPPVAAIRAVPPATRRRAVFKARKGAIGVELGFYEAGSRTLVDLVECKVLVPALEKRIAPLKTILGGILNGGETAEIHVTDTDSGVDLSLNLKRKREPDILMALAEAADRLKLARLSWNGELLAMAVAPSLAIGPYTVLIPPEAFLQATQEGERELQTLARESLGSARMVADLFSGCGSFALALGGDIAVHAVDSASAQIEALKQAARPARGRITTETRDLYRRPLLQAELSRFEAVVLDPPRPGAASQAETLAQSAVPRVLYASCNPASFARDARMLVNGGYALERVVPLDQFLWSPHVEMFGVFVRL